MLRKIKIILLIAKWEFKEKFLHKAFLISFCLSQFLLFITVYFINSTTEGNKTTVYPIAIISNSKNLDNSFLRKLTKSNDYIFVKINKNNYLDTNNTFNVNKVLNGTFIACLEIFENKYSLSISSSLNKDEIIGIQNYLNAIINDGDVIFYDLLTNKDGIIDKKLISIIGIVLIFVFTILISSNMFLRGFSIEKESKLLELLVSSTRIENILMGKSIGFFIFILLQFIVWFIIASITSDVLFYETFHSIWVIVLLCLEVLFYIVFFLIASLLSKHDSDANIILSSITFFLLLPFLLIENLVYSKDSIISNLLIYFPFTSFPSIIIKSVRYNYSTSEILLAILIMITTIVFIVSYISKSLISKPILNKVLTFNSKKVKHE